MFTLIRLLITPLNSTCDLILLLCFCPFYYCSYNCCSCCYCPMLWLCSVCIIGRSRSCPEALKLHVASGSRSNSGRLIPTLPKNLSQNSLTMPQISTFATRTNSVLLYRYGTSLVVLWSELYASLSVYTRLSMVSMSGWTCMHTAHWRGWQLVLGQLHCKFVKQ